MRLTVRARSGYQRQTQWCMYQMSLCAARVKLQVRQRQTVGAASQRRCGVFQQQILLCMSIKCAMCVTLYSTGSCDRSSTHVARVLLHMVAIHTWGGCLCNALCPFTTLKAAATHLTTPTASCVMLQLAAGCAQRRTPAHQCLDSTSS